MHGQVPDYPSDITGMETKYDMWRNFTIPFALLCFGFVGRCGVLQNPIVVYFYFLVVSVARAADVANFGHFFLIITFNLVSERFF
jgi:hypothetical protein